MDVLLTEQHFHRWPTERQGRWWWWKNWSALTTRRKGRSWRRWVNNGYWLHSSFIKVYYDANNTEQSHSHGENDHPLLKNALQAKELVRCVCVCMWECVCALSTRAVTIHQLTIRFVSRYLTHDSIHTTIFLIWIAFYLNNINNNI